VDADGRPAGLLDITDLIGMVPVEDAEGKPGPRAARVAEVA
jgi:hypothetical protein